MRGDAHAYSSLGNVSSGVGWNTKTIGLILFCLVCVVAFNAMAWASWHPWFILNDGVQYLSTAGNWLAGRGFSTDALMYTPHFQGQLPAPQTVWPPGLPFLLALASFSGVSLEDAALAINLISLFISALLVLVILLRNKVSFNAAMCCAMIFYCTAIPWSYSLSLIAEPLFSMLILAAILSQPNDLQGRIWPWIVSGIFIALCISVRYTGVFFSLGVGLGMFAYLVKNYRSRPELFWRGIKLVTLQISISVVLFVALLYRTYLLTGTTSRNIGSVQTEANWFARFKVTVWQIKEFFGFTDEGFLPSSFGTLLLGIFLLLCLIVLLQISYVSVKARNRALPASGSNSDVMSYVTIAHSVIFAMFFSFHVIGISLVELTHRYLYQIYPGLFILLCIMVSDSFKKITLLKLNGWKNSLSLSLAALFSLFAVAQLNNAAGLQYHARPGMQIEEVVAIDVSESTDLHDMIQSCFVGSGSMAGAIWSNAGQQLHRATGVPTITIADVYGNKPYDMVNVQNHVATYDIRMFVILNNLPDIAPEYIQMLTNVKRWLALNGYMKVPVLEDQISNDITVEVYAVDPACVPAKLAEFD